MTIGISSRRLELTEEEAFALLALAMTSANELDVTSQTAMRKLADFCREYYTDERNYRRLASRELSEAG